MRKYILWGSGGHAKVLAPLIKQAGGVVVALFDNNRAVESSLKGVPLYYGEDGFKDWLSQQSNPRDFFGLVAVGVPYGKVRTSIQHFLLSHQIQMPPLVASSATVSPDVPIGEGTHVLPYVNISAEAEIGSACILNHHVNIDHECRIGNGVHLAPRATLCGCVKVGNYAMIGAGAVVISRLTIGEGALVGAGAVVIRDVPKDTVVVGNPARFLRREEREYVDSLDLIVKT